MQHQSTYHKEVMLFFSETDGKESFKLNEIKEFQTIQYKAYKKGWCFFSVTTGQKWEYCVTHS